MVSMLRIYSPEQLRKLTADFQPPDYFWELGQVRVHGIPDRLPYLIGQPIRQGPRILSAFQSSLFIAVGLRQPGLGNGSDNLTQSERALPGASSSRLPTIHSESLAVYPTPAVRCP